MATTRLLTECEAAKIQLSVYFDVEIRVPSIAEDIDLSVQLSRHQLEAMMKPWIARLKEPLQNALKDSNMEKDEIDIILLVGGSSKIPAVK